MIDYDDFVAFLHIIHVSDIHYRDRKTPITLKTERLLRTLARRLRKIAPPLAAAVEEQLALGFAGHDPTADKAMRDFLAWFIRDPDFGTLPAWLLDTGDLSAIGDQHSIAEAKNLLGRYKSIIASNQNSQANNPVGANGLLFSLYGNHDAWPETFPLWAHSAKLDAHRNALRNGLFPPFWPQGPLSIPIPYTKSRLMLHGVNSAIDDRWDNTFALGKVEIDPAWTASVPSVDQLQHLAHGVTRGFHPDGVTRDYRILAVHHPIHYPPPRPNSTKFLRNDDDVANTLVQFEQHRRGKLAQLILSGHTHETYPRFGVLPESTAGLMQDPLKDGQLQLVTASLAKMPGTNADPYPQRFQVLTFFASPPTAPHQLVMERRVLGRLGGVGKYVFLKRADSAQESEAVLLDY